jgi:transcriptional/translational regulatory protein YebC/TACO1
LEALIDRALRSALPADEVEAARAEAAEQLRPYKSRMEPATYEQTLDNLLAKSLREAAGVPRLSLFYL